MDHRFTLYIPGETLLHRLNPLTKLVCAATLALLSFLSPWVYTPALFLGGILLPAVVSARIARPFSVTLLKFFLPFAVMLFAVHGFLYQGEGTVLAEICGYPIIREGVLHACSVSSRILVVVSSFSLLVFTTGPDALMRVLEEKGVPWAVTYPVLAAILLVPQTRDRAGAILDAQQARGVDITGSLGRRVRALLPLTAPLVFGTIVQAQERALALELKGMGNKGKTRLVSPADTKGERVFRQVCLYAVILTAGYRLWMLLY